MTTELQLFAALLAWRRDIDSVPLPEITLPAPGATPHSERKTA
ncbi:hypothetical protein [Amycolatopsis sp. YIM 10]|nr:hypothetical protein [Amycolatopsis sp. YIM 10]QFU87851.1 hypothetical protein YIM_13325 [Amycolatopsis sp. YIM 10]QFU94836.1 hypothetical protein YIM_48555 [Amycolatopsis sp. YIM 10]